MRVACDNCVLRKQINFNSVSFKQQTRTMISSNRIFFNIIIYFTKTHTQLICQRNITISSKLTSEPSLMDIALGLSGFVLELFTSL